MSRTLAFLFLLFCAVGDARAAVPEDCRQLVVGVAEHWDDSHVVLSKWVRLEDGSWEQEGQAVPGRLGRHGLAWGRGLHPAGLPGPVKEEGDGRAPAGVFRLGAAYGYAEDVERHSGLPYHRVTEADLWVEDVDSPHYNRHLRLPGGRVPQTEWEKKAQMRQNDHAHSLKLFIAHNAAPDVVPGAGSAIFFHIWRQDGGRASFGCTVIDETRMKRLVAWVDPDKKPCYVLLTRPDYDRMHRTWGLPSTGGWSAPPPAAPSGE